MQQFGSENIKVREKKYYHLLYIGQVPKEGKKKQKSKVCIMGVQGTALPSPAELGYLDTGAAG